MSWPTDDLDTEHFDAGDDSPASARSVLKTLIDRVKEMIAALGATGGVCDLGDDGKVPGQRMGRAEAGGVAPLDDASRLPRTHLPDATETDKGAVRLATGAEVSAGTNAEKAVTPETLAGVVKSVSITRVETNKDASQTQAVRDVLLSASVTGTSLELTLTVQYETVGDSTSTTPSPTTTPPLGGSKS